MQYLDIQRKRPKKIFETKEEKERFIQAYLSKEKTELCKNWEAYYYCKFGDRCSFAHGIEELRIRTDMLPTYKLRQCKQFIEMGLCSYGTRCQFIHNNLTLEKQREASYSKMLNENCKFIKVRINCLTENRDVYVSSYERRRLRVFSQLADGVSI